jgi:hypothetical protein
MVCEVPSPQRPPYGSTLNRVAGVSARLLSNRAGLFSHVATRVLFSQRKNWFNL